MSRRQLGYRRPRMSRSRQRSGVPGPVAPPARRSCQYKTPQVMGSAMENYRILIESSPVAICVICYGSFRYINPLAAEMMGVNAEQAIGLSILNFCHPDDREMVLANHTNRLQDNIVPPYVFRLLSRHGNVRRCEVTAVKINWENDIASLIYVNDITERLEAEEALKVREAQYRNLVETQTAFICRFNSAGEIGYVNDAFRKYFASDGKGQSPVGASIFNYIQSGDPRLIREFYRGLSEAKPVREVERRAFVPIDGREHIINWIVKAVYNDKHELDSYLLVGTDVTEQRLAQQALRGSEEKYRAVVENSTELIAVSQHWTLKYVNPRFCELAERNSEEIIGSSFLDLIHPEDREDVQDYYFKRLNGQELDYPSRFRLVSVSGAIYQVESIGAPFVWEGRPATLYFVTDVTQRHVAEAEMSRLQKMLQGIFDSMPSVLIGCDTQGIVTNWNEQAICMTGVDRTEALGKPVYSLLPLVAGPIQAVLEGRTDITRTPQRLRVDENGEERIYDLLVYRLDSSAGGGLVIRLDDVTRRVRADEIMVQNEKMVSMGALAAGMAHEINNPLGGIMQGAQNIVRRIDPKLEPNRQTAEECGITIEAVHEYMKKRQILRFIEGIRQSGSRASVIVNHMLHFVRRSDAQKTPENLEYLIERAVELASQDYDLCTRYDFRHIEVRRHYAPLNKPVECVALEIEQVLFNLIKNAAQAMRGCNRSPVLEITTGWEPGYATIEISDNGPGMDESLKRRAFEPFFTTKQTGAGTGLGLAVAYYVIVENHEGSILLDTRPGHGSRFIIKLPAGPKKETIFAANNTDIARDL